ncbi:TetR/AcrR family transcriptional regulator [Cryobacterium zhongshanensis]|uniref:TetR/AcrR family transcriptional regulator n=1 Tax=Cryobacterium zhongshanensis TaxID=2928153 RepID=A0AA41QWX5_9MICO|nr:TetR/AcrR family transcriptional regulator [Cryobacterium zhongshanensis]MCI4658093.1 TetR/AcrR family transcriptional regulator [Cryobacterium zhongshanensis]
MNEQKQRRPGRPRDPEIHNKVLLAAQRVYVQGGRAGFTFEAIAREAAVGKPAIYRRWASVDDLMDDVLRSHTLVPENVLQGDLRGELQEIAMATLRLAHSEQGAFILRLSSERGLQPGLYRQYFERLRNVIHFQNRALIVAAITRDELSTECDPDILIQAITGSVLVGTLMGFVPPPRDAEAAARYCEHLVNQLLQGALPSHQPLPHAVRPDGRARA